jgi:hypothetical protein
VHQRVTRVDPVVQLIYVPFAELFCLEKEDIHGQGYHRR